MKISNPTNIHYIYPFEKQCYSEDWAGAAGHDIDIITRYDSTSTANTNGWLQATSNNDDDFDYLIWVFNLPPDFLGFTATPLSIDTYSTVYTTTALEITLNVNGAVDGTVNALSINPTASSAWQTKTSSLGGSYTSANANQRCYILIKFLGDNTNVLRVKNLSLAYYTKEE